MRTDAAVAPAPAPLVDRVKNYAAVIGAVVGAITALWGVYEKVRSEARADTASSYNTLAPQVNQLGEALKELQRENQKLREVVAQHQDRPRIASTPAARPPRAGSSNAAPSAAVNTPPSAAGTVPAPAGEARDPVGDLLDTVGRTRAAIETLRKVPDDFGHVLEKRKKADGGP